MLVGTGSEVGKSVLCTALCRIFLEDGLHPAPFKAQNMSLNSYATPDGLEIGRAQAVQAEAAGIPCRVEMNPILLKPTSPTSSQVVLNGKPIGNQTASEYFGGTHSHFLIEQAMKSCYRLMASYNPLVIEGAGSISEINLRDRDITNLRVAEALQAPTFLVADIDRGGVFASVYGSIQLLPTSQRDLIKGIIINKFRGDSTLFEEGKKQLEAQTGKPVVGVIPYLDDLFIEQEDSVILERVKRQAGNGKINLAVILLPHMSNFTDFNALERHPDVHLYYATQPDDLQQAAIMLLPGTKNTLADLDHLWKSGLAKTIQEAHLQGKAVYGLCGGFQMMGESVSDPSKVEGELTFLPGLGLLPIKTVITPEKKSRQITFQFLSGSNWYKGYEIHMGYTEASSDSPLCRLDDQTTDGYFLNAKTFGSYIHGLFDHQETIQYILRQVSEVLHPSSDLDAFKETQYHRLSHHVRTHLDMDYLYQTIRL